MTRNMPENRINYKIILSSFCAHFVFDYHRTIIRLRFGCFLRQSSDLHPPICRDCLYQLTKSDKNRRQIALQTRVLWCIFQFIHILTQMGVASFVRLFHVGRFLFTSLFAQWGVDKHLEESLLKSCQGHQRCMPQQ